MERMTALILHRNHCFLKLLTSNCKYMVKLPMSKKEKSRGFNQTYYGIDFKNLEIIKSIYANNFTGNIH